MKKLVIGLMLLAGSSYAACNGPYCWDESTAYTDPRVPFKPAVLTLQGATTTQMLTLVPATAGELRYCSSGCETTGMVCLSTGTGIGAWVHISSKTTSGVNSLVPCDQ